MVLLELTNAKSEIQELKVVASILKEEVEAYKANFRESKGFV